MRVIARIRAEAADERGGILVFFALALPLLVLIVVAVADAGNWFEHRRHLQVQADAAALAGGTAFGYPCTAGINEEIEDRARLYGGAHTKYEYPGGSPTFSHTDYYDVSLNGKAYNNQVGGTSIDRLHLLINAAIDGNPKLGYWRDPDGDEWHDDRRDFTDTSGDSLGRACESGFIDVKVTENDLPWLIPFGEYVGLDSVVSWIDARARVQIQKIAAFGGPALLPLFVRDVSPKSAAALFVRENADGSMALLDAEYMTKKANCDSGYACWSNDTPGEVPILAGAATSAVVALSSLEPCGPGAPAQCFDITGGTPEAICYQEGAQCYWASESAQDVRAGLVFVQGYSTSGGGAPPNPPALREVTLGSGLSGTPCPDGYYSFTEIACTIHVRATIDMGGFETSQPNDVRVRAFGGSCGNNGCAMNYLAIDNVWIADVTIPAVGNNPANFTPTQPLRLEWTYKQTTLTLNGTSTPCGNSFNNSPCTGSFTNAHRSFSGSDYFSGPIRTVGLVDADDLTRNAYSYEDGTTARLVLGVKLAGAVARCPRTDPECDTAPDDPPIRLRVATNQGAVDCDPTVATFREELTVGCNPLYSILDENDPRWDQADPCNPPYTNAQALFQSPQPWDCVRPETGEMQGQFSDGMKGRVLNGGVPCTGGNCPSEPQNGCARNPGDNFVAGRNYWEAGADGFGSYLDERHPGDPRVVVLFMVPFGAFRDTGSDQLYPVVNFGAFYISDWGGNASQDDPCGIDGDGIPAGWMSGHFINYVTPSNVGGGTGEQCDPSAFTPCVPVLVE